MTTNPQLNRNATLDEIAQHVRQTADALFEGDQDAVSDLFIELYDLLFPDGSRPATAEEIAALEMDPPADYLILQDDDLTRTDRTEAETMELLHEVQNQILDGEKEPAAFLEALELMYRISRQYTAASVQAAQQAEQAEARLMQLIQDYQRLLGVLNWMSQGVNRSNSNFTN